MTLLLYTLGQVLLAAGLAAAALRSNAVLPMPVSGRVAVGLAATPFVSATLAAAIMTLWPGQPVMLLALLPLLAGLFLVVAMRRAAGDIAAALRGVSWPEPLFWIAAACLAVLAFIVLTRMAHYVVQPTGNSDSLQYLAQAQHLLGHRSLFAYSGIEGLPDGTLRGDAHGVLWIAYLASALAMAPADDTVAADALARVAFQLALCGYLAAGIAVASLFRLRLAVPFAIVFLLAVPSLSGASIGGDRDAFRLAALLMLLAFLLAHARSRFVFVRHPGVALLACMLGFWSMQGHGLALVLVPVLTGVWFLACIALRLPVLRGFVLALAVAIGFGVAAWPVASAYLRTGSPVGENVAAAQVLEGTPYLKGVSQRDEARVGAGADRLARIGITIGRDAGWPSLLALATLAALVVAALKRWRAGSASRADATAPVLLAAWFVALSLLLLDALPLGYFEIGAWTVLNLRYAMQWYVAAGLLAAWGIAALLVAAQRRLPQRGLVVAGLAGGALIFGTLMTARTLERGWPIYQTGTYRIFADGLNALTASLPARCRILSEDTGVNFHARRTVVQMYSRHLVPLMREQSPQALVERLDARDLCVVVLYTGLYIDTAGPETPLARALASDAFRLHDAAPWRIYIRTPLAP
jgi:hypothetical protein